MDRLELEALKGEVELVKLRVQAPDDHKLGLEPIVEAHTPAARDNDAEHKSAFAKFASTFRSASSRQSKSEECPPSGPRLDQRRGSADSDATLVNVDPASSLLTMLAPVIANLQQLGIRISAVSPPDNSLLVTFRGLCIELEQLLDALKAAGSTAAMTADGKAYDHDQEMRTLLLKALTRKVQIERERSMPPPVALAPSPTSATSKVNPFVVHSSALLSGRKKTTSKPIGGPATQGGSAAPGVQSMWRANVFRVGSYQASMLFSPSPVAVKRPL